MMIGTIYCQINEGSMSMPTETKKIAPKRSFTGLMMRSMFSASIVSAKMEPMSEFRRYVDTTDAIDYNRYLGYAGLQLNGYKIERLPKCDALASKIRASLLGN